MTWSFCWICHNHALLICFLARSGCRYTRLPSFSLPFHNNPDLIVIELKSIFTWKVLQHRRALLCGLILITSWGHPVWWHRQCLSENPHPKAELENNYIHWSRRMHSAIHYTFRSLPTLQHFAGTSALLCAHFAGCADVLCWSCGSIGSVVVASRRLTNHDDVTVKLSGTAQTSLAWCFWFWEKLNFITERKERRAYINWSCPWDH